MKYPVARFGYPLPTRADEEEDVECRGTAYTIVMTGGYNDDGNLTFGYRVVASDGSIHREAPAIYEDYYVILTGAFRAVERMMASRQALYQVPLPT